MFSLLDSFLFLQAEDAIDDNNKKGIAAGYAAELEKLLASLNDGEHHVSNETATTEKTRGHQLLCTLEQLSKGEWVPAVYDYAPYDSPPLQTCLRKLSKNATYQTHDWKPFTDCEFSTWQKDEFCKLAANKTIGFIGDSLTYEHFQDLVYRWNIPLSFKMSWSRNGGKPLFKTLCNQSVTVFYHRSKNMRTTANLKTTKPDILILNRGAHFVSDNEIVADWNETLKDLHNWQQDCLTNNKTCQLLYRTTVPGHPQCLGDKEPSHSLEDMEARVENRSNYPGLWGTFHYWEFKRQNGLILELLRQSCLNYSVLPAYEINMLRPDEHGGESAAKPGNNYYADCLHSCLPGKIGVYNRILGHSLRIAFSP
jgi:hypothetical protein